jgi:hypothetical protein
MPPAALIPKAKSSPNTEKMSSEMQQFIASSNSWLDDLELQKTVAANVEGTAPEADVQSNSKRTTRSSVSDSPAKRPNLDPSDHVPQSKSTHMSKLQQVMLICAVGESDARGLLSRCG